MAGGKMKVQRARAQPPSVLPFMPKRRSGRTSKVPHRENMLSLYSAEDTLPDDASPEEIQAASEAFDQDTRHLSLLEDDGDWLDWLPNDPTRPAPAKTLWSQVYAPLTRLKTGNLTIMCGEGCGQLVEMNSSYQELNSTTTPHGVLRKPPICHDVPWAVLKIVIEEQKVELQKHVLPSQRQDFRKAFVRDVCWHLPNLRPGHNDCNAQGTKSTSTFYSPDEKRKAEAIFKTVYNAPPYNQNPY